MRAVNKSIAFTSVFAIIILFFIALNISNINVNAAVTAPSSVSGSIKLDGSNVTSIALGKTVTISASATGGSGGDGRHYEYMYQYQAPGTSSFITLKNYTTSTSANFKPSVSGTYTIRIFAKVVDDTASSSAVSTSLTLKVVELSNTSTIGSSNITLGESVTISASATGGSSYTYKYSYYGPEHDGSKYYYLSPSTPSSPYSTSSTLTYKPTKTGTYYFKVVAKDTSTGATNEKQFSVVVNSKEYSTLVNNSTINKTEFYLNEKLVVQAAASGGSGSYQYKYEFCDLNGNPISDAVVQDFSTKTTYSIKLENTTDSYMMKVTVKDTKTNKTSVKKLTFEIKDKEYPSLTLNTTINSTTINTPNNSSGNDTLKIQATASGGSGDYTYQYNYIKDGGEEETFGANDDICEGKYFGGVQENSSFDVQILKPGSYKIIIYVFDSRGVFVKRVHNITVNQAPKYTKGELSDLVSQVESWYTQLTPSQVQIFRGLTEVNSEDEFEFDNWETALNNAKTVINSGSEYEVDDVYEELEKQQTLAKKQTIIASEASSVLFSISSSLSDLLNWLLTGIGNLLTQNFGTSSSESAFGGFDIKGFVDTYSPIFTIFASSLLVLLFGVNVISSAIQYELFTLKGAVTTFARLIFAELWVQLSTKICLLVVDIAGEILTQIIDKAGDILENIDFSFAFTYHSDIWLVGQVIDFLVMILVMIVIFLMFIPLLFFLIKVIVKLFVMNFELAALTAMSPAFFACLVGQETKQYFKNFVSTFLSIVIEVIFMGIVYAAFINWYNGFGDLSTAMDLSSLDIGSQITNFAIFAIVFIAACSLMIKPPQVFKNLIR